MSLSAGMFADFFHAVHGVSPFPWQVRLVEHVLAKGWPATIDLPTASGKTACLDVAVFALACQADLPPDKRSAPRRIALVVDRRVVVDDAARRAARIVEHLREPYGSHILRQVAEALLPLGGESPIESAVLRGGLYRDERWARTPSQPTLIISTVDQIGSRLLFRGYGLSPYAQPIHAGLLAHDTIVLLDEAHCSEPFLQTLANVTRYRKQAAAAIPAPFACVAMTATPRSDALPFQLHADDRAHQILGPRLSAGKTCRLVKADNKKSVAALVEAARVCAAPGMTVAVVVNRVATARQVWTELAKTQDVLLLTGRVRPVERDALLARPEYRNRIAAGRDRASTAEAPPLFVVATQCIEVGADLDFDALVSEICPLDSLRQRLGRLDRLGQRGNSDVVVIATSEQAEPDYEDVIYGKALNATWQWLDKNACSGVIEVGTSAMDALLPQEPGGRAALLAGLVGTAPNAPVMFPAYCDLWAQTSPAPLPSPAPAPFLHGPDCGEPEVAIVWRADLPADAPESWGDIVALCPPVSGEVLRLPLSAARRWLASAAENADSESDMEGQRSVAEESRRDQQVTTWRMALCWSGPDASYVVQNATSIRPGDTLVVPASYGGCDAFGWNPDALVSADLADLARQVAHRSAVLRIHAGLADQWGGAAATLTSLTTAAELSEDIEERIDQTLANIVSGVPEPLATILNALRKDKRRQVLLHPSGSGLVLLAHAGTGDRSEFTDDDDTSARSTVMVTLDNHLADVASRTLGSATALGLPTTLAEDLALAARLHDLGKADPRFQALLNGGDALAAARAGLLAKSPRLPRSAAAAQIAHRRSGYPVGARHELLSARLAEGAIAGAHNPALVLHLIGAHHGRCRPFAPVVTDDKPLNVSTTLDGRMLSAATDTGLERLDSGVPERFWSLVKQYGWWGLAYLEAIVRLADHRASETPATGGKS